MDNIDFYLYDLKTKFNKINPNEYYLSYSGGKDSHLLYWFIKEYLKDCIIDIVGCNTGMEFPEIKDRIIENSDIVLTPKKSIVQIKREFGIPCFSKEQDFYIYYYQKAIREGKEPAKTYKDKINGTYKTGFNLSKYAADYVKSEDAHNITHLCCYYLKKKTFHDYEKKSGKKAILGVRGNESTLRRKQYTSCFTKDRKFTPLWDLTDDLENKIYEKYKIEIPNIYNYVCRTGCIGCPYGSHYGDTEKELEYIKRVDKSRYDFIINLFKDSYKIKKVKYTV